MDKVSWRIRNVKTREVLEIAKSVFKVGRSVSADLTSVNTALSRNHATFSVLIDGFLYIQDNKSSNGTFVNNQKIPGGEMKLLNQGDIVGFGCCEDMCDNKNFEQHPLLFEVEKNDCNTPDSKVLEQESNKTVSNSSSAGFSRSAIDCIVISDGEDDDDPFTNSQIYKLSEEIKKEQTSFNESIDPYSHIKHELEDLDYCNNLQNIVDLTSDVDHFDTAFDLLRVLDSPIPKDNIVEEECSSSVPPKPKYVKPPIVQPHTIKINEKKKPLKENDDSNNESKTSKRKNADAGPTVTKKIKTSCNLKKTRCDKKSIEDEFKKRNRGKNGTTHKKEVNKESKQAILTERKKKLKKLSEKESNKNNCEAVTKTAKSTSKIKTSDGRGNFLLEVNGVSTTRGENHATDAIPSTSKCSPKSSVNVGCYSNSTKKECNEVPSHSKKKPHNDQIIQDTTISSNCSPKSDTNKAQMSNPSPDTHKTFRFQKPDSTDNENRYGLIWQSAANHYRSSVPNFTRNNTNVDDQICKMVYWPVKWLFEQNNFDISPPVNGEKQLVKMPLFFGNFAYYYNIVTPLILLEMWQYIHQTFYNKDEERTPVRVHLNHKRIIGELTYLDCECYMSEEDVRRNNLFRTDDFTIIELKLKDAANYYLYDGFGYIKFCRRIDLRDDMIINNEIAELCPEIPYTYLKFTVVTRNLSDKQISGKQIVIKVIANVASYLRLIKTVKYLETSPVSKQVLNPTIENYKIPMEDNSNIIVEVNLNSQQKEIVLEACSLCLRNEPGMYLIKGPPGTGKSTVIVNIVLQLLFSSVKSNRKPPLILLTAPSNAAVDNLILKLAETRTKLPEHQKRFLKLVRIGPDSSISKDVDKFKLSSLARNHMLKESGLTASEEFKVALENGVEIEEFLRKRLGQRYFYDLKCSEDVLLFGSNVICTTLNSCVSSRLMDAFRRDQLKFSFCITDEATQCSEAESLLPIQLGIEKFVLVGDPQQLPAVVCNKDAQKLGYGKSLFARIADNFKKYKNNPVKMLHEQYRMHHEICEYPNKTFYEGQLRSLPMHTNRIVPELKPYLLFNLMNTQNHDNSDYRNSEEAQLIYNILSTLQKCIQSNCKYSVGIITPYRAQKDLLIRQTSNIRFSPNVSVTVNTVDSFQGMENDIIIISCVRYNPNNFLQNEQRLNVALTRAKQALYIIGNYTLFKHCRLLYDLREDAKKRKLCMDVNQNPKNITNLQKYLIQR